MVLGSVTDTVKTLASVVGDPALPELLTLVRKLHDIEVAKATGTTSSSTSTTPTDYRAGVGLAVAIQPLRALIYARQHPWVAPAAVAGVLALPLLLGFVAGRRVR